MPIIPNVCVESAVMPAKRYALAKIVRIAELVTGWLVNRFGVGQPVMRIGLDKRELLPLPAPALEMARAYWEELDSRRAAALGCVTVLAGRIAVSAKLLGEGKCLVPSGLRWPIDTDCRAVFDPKPHLLVLGGPVDGLNVRVLRREGAAEIDGFLGVERFPQVRHQVVSVGQGDSFGVVIWFPHEHFQEPGRPLERRFIPCFVGMDKCLHE